MKKKQDTLYDIDCEVRKELGLEIITKDHSHGNINFEDKEINILEKEWKNFMIYRYQIFIERGEK